MQTVLVNFFVSIEMKPWKYCVIIPVNLSVLEDKRGSEKDDPEAIISSLSSSALYLRILSRIRSAIRCNPPFPSYAITFLPQFHKVLYERCVASSRSDDQATSNQVRPVRVTNA